MDMDVEMAVQMGRHEAPGQEPFDLRRHNLLYAPPLGCLAQQPQTPSGRMLFAKHQMNSHAQRRHSPGPGHGIQGGRAVDHEAGETQDALLEGPGHGFVDLDAGAEVIRRGDEQALGYQDGATRFEFGTPRPWA